MISAKAKLSILVAAHVVCGWLLSLSAQRFLGEFSLPLFALLALTFADAGLLGVWAGLPNAACVEGGRPGSWAPLLVDHLCDCVFGAVWPRSTVWHDRPAERRRGPGAAQLANDARAAT